MTTNDQARKSLDNAGGALRQACWKVISTMDSYGHDEGLLIKRLNVLGAAMDAYRQAMEKARNHVN